MATRGLTPIPAHVPITRCPPRAARGAFYGRHLPGAQTDLQQSLPVSNCGLVFVETGRRTKPAPTDW